jgi:transcription-repair coupling factor (superfamily II helicase)
MEQIGYDLYVRILNKAISRLTGKKAEDTEERPDCTVELGINAYISNEYMPGDLSRMEMYKKIAVIDSPAVRDEIMKELEDRFGKPPVETVSLLDIALLRNMASEAGAERISRSGAEVRFEFRSGAFPKAEALPGITGISPGRVVINVGSNPYISYRNQSSDHVDMKNLVKLVQVLEHGG